MDRRGRRSRSAPAVAKDRPRGPGRRAGPLCRGSARHRTQPRPARKPAPRWARGIGCGSRLRRHRNHAERFVADRRGRRVRGPGRPLPLGSATAPHLSAGNPEGRHRRVGGNSARQPARFRQPRRRACPDRGTGRPLPRTGGGVPGLPGDRRTPRVGATRHREDDGPHTGHRRSDRRGQEGPARLRDQHRRGQRPEGRPERTPPQPWRHRPRRPAPAQGDRRRPAGVPSPHGPGTGCAAGSGCSTWP